MTIHRIRLLGDPILRASCEPITRPGSTAVRVIMDDMRETLRDWQSRFGSGRAIAAPQIGAPVRMIYGEMDKPWPLINPEIVDIGNEDFEVWDDCFSFPNLLVGESPVPTGSGCATRTSKGSGTRRSWRATGRSCSSTRSTTSTACSRLIGLTGWIRSAFGRGAPALRAQPPLRNTRAAERGLCLADFGVALGPVSQSHEDRPSVLGAVAVLEAHRPHRGVGADPGPDSSDPTVVTEERSPARRAPACQLDPSE